MERQFQRPKMYDPALAERPLAPLPAMGVTRQQHMHDLGFDDDSPHQTSTNGLAGGEDVRVRELLEQLTEARQRLAETERALEESKGNESRSGMKMQSFQQVNRSQTSLMKAELQKTRRKLAHMQAVATRLREQAAFFQQQAPSSLLPYELQGLPTEDAACAQGEGEELAKLQQKWEQDIIQLHSILVKPGGLEQLGCGSSNSEADEEAKKRIKDLESALRKQQKQIRELQASPGGSPTASTATGSGEEVEAVQEQLRDSQKKLKQLATAYRKLEQEKNDALKALQQGGGGGGRGASVRPETLRGLQVALAESKSQIVALRNQVSIDYTQQLPALLEQAMQSKLPELQQMLANGSKEWQEKYMIECDKRRKLHNLVQELRGNVRVYCRVRPLNARESGSCISFPSPDEIRIQNEETGTKKTWQFNMVLNEKSTQSMLFDGVRDLVVSMLDGYNVCIFAFGQTGAGKTHSMQGTKDQPGIYTRTFNELFKVAADRKGWNVELKGALLEVYNEELRDLLADPKGKREKLQIKQGKDGNYVPNLTIRPLNCPADVEALLDAGSANRSTAATDMNEHSSRSHLLVQIFGCVTNPSGKTTNSTITLVDLAGSERVAKSGVSGDRMKEAIAINTSLNALGNVINARAAKSSHTPFRNSVLTHLLQDSLSGDSKTLMLLAINPCKDHVEESCSLQFGARVNNVEMKK